MHVNQKRKEKRVNTKYAERENNGAILYVKNLATYSCSTNVTFVNIFTNNRYSNDDKHFLTYFLFTA